MQSRENIGTLKQVTGTLLLDKEIDTNNIYHCFGKRHHIEDVCCVSRSELMCIWLTECHGFVFITQFLGVQL